MIVKSKPAAERNEFAMKRHSRTPGKAMRLVSRALIKFGGRYP
jgi:hypothetical protein